ncbi:MAG: hypothetical protein KJ749_09920 [Planctomycetes bacterium]|nr:hypothetical protein [Planctomycetota bacterium]
MRNAGSFVSLAAVVLVFFAAPRSSMGDVVLYDDFDDENWDGWSVYNPYGEPGDTLTTVLVPSPEGWAVRGVGSGYGSPEAAYLVHPLALSGVVELSIEMRARSGSSHPTHSTIALFSGADYNAGYDYGEFSLARFQVRYDGIESVLLDYSLSAAHDWHDFKWSRDGQ